MRTRSLLLSLLCAVLALAMCPVPAGADEPAVTISGSKAATNVGAIVTGVTGSTTYVWTVDGVVTPSVNLNGEPIDPARFILLEEHIGKPVVVTATVTPNGGGAAVTLVSAPVVPTPGKIVYNAPTITGQYLIGRPMTAVPNTVYPRTGVTYQYQWMLWGEPIKGATGPTFTPGPDLLQRFGLEVRITYSKPGWEGGSAKSDYDFHSFQLAYIKASGAEIGGPMQVGQHAWVDDPPNTQGCPCTRTIEWLIAGKVVAKTGGEDPTVVLKREWVGKSLSAKLTLSRPYVDSVTLVTPERTVMRGDLRPPDTWESRFRANQTVGWIATVAPYTFPFPTTQSIQWSRDGVAIPGATGASYRYSKADVGRFVAATVTVKAQGMSGEYVMGPMGGGRVAFNVYTTPGSHTVAGREWRTTCERYSQTIRCRAEIMATQVVKVNGRWAQRTGYVFNNLTYLPLASGTWGKNPLARNGEWIDAAGRQWRTECDTPATGRGACRTYIRSNAQEKWVFNNLVYTR